MIKKGILAIILYLAIEILLITECFAGDISAKLVGISVCIFLIMEATILIKNQKLELALIASPALVVIYYSHKPKILVWLIIIYGFYLLCKLQQYENNQMLEKLHGIRDESFELETRLTETNKRLRKEQDNEIHLATISERGRIAREIHDNVGHMISRAIILLGAIKTINKDESMVPHLEKLSETLDVAMHEMRTSVHDLRDEAIDLNQNIKEALAGLDEYQVYTDIDLGLEPSVECQLTLIAVLREATANIIRHSNGDSVKVTLHEHPGFVTLSVKDNGTISKEDRERINSGVGLGIGLNNIEERARVLGGFARFSTDDGFEVFVNIPSEPNK